MISRRKFLKAGSFVALAAAIPVSVLGQSWKDKDGNPGDQGAQPDPLSHYNQAAFTSYLNSIFQIYTGTSIVEVELVRVKDLPTGGPAAPSGGECFSLVFVGGSKAFEQGTYRIAHPSLGTFQLFLVPSGADAVGAQSYVATINRIGYSPDLLNPPTRSFKEGEKAVPQSPAAPNKPQTLTPAPVTSPAQTPKPKRKAKPSWKRDGIDGDFESLLIDQ
jgi:hypothetical protein